MFNLTPHYKYSAMPFKEEYRINGRLSNESIEKLIHIAEDVQTFDIEEVEESIENIGKDLDCIEDYLPSEGIYEDVVDKLKDLKSSFKKLSLEQKEMFDELFSTIEGLEYDVVEESHAIKVDYIKSIKSNISDLNKNLVCISKVNLWFLMLV